MDKRRLSEHDICTGFIMPALRKAGGHETLPIREELSLTRSRIIVRDKPVMRGRGKCADYKNRTRQDGHTGAAFRQFCAPLAETMAIVDRALLGYHAQSAKNEIGLACRTGSGHIPHGSCGWRSGSGRRRLAKAGQGGSI